MKKYFDLLKSKAKDIIMLMMVIGLGYLMFTVSPPQKVKVDTNITETGKLVPKNIPTPVASCSKTEVEYILRNDDDILKDTNLFVIDLNTMRFIEDKITTSYYSKKPIYGVKYELQGSKQVYLMIYEDVDNLKYNKKYYDRLHKSK